MSGSRFFTLRIAALTGSLLILSVATSAAAPAHGSGPVPAAPAYHDGYHAPAVAAYHGGYYYRGGRYPGYGGYYYGAYYLRVVVGLGSYASYYYPTMNYIYTTPSVVESPSYYYSPTIMTEPPAPAPAVTNTATVIVRVPADADVWFNGEPTSTKGEVREFTSPPLTSGSDYRYVIRARWTDAGGAADQTRTVVVRANGRTEVDFTRPEPVAPPTPAK